MVALNSETNNIQTVILATDQQPVGTIALAAIPFTTDSDGAATVYSRDVAGLVVDLWVDVGSGGTAIAAGTDLTITEEATGAAIATLSNVGSASDRYAPRLPVHDSTGTGTGALDAPAVVGRIKVVVAQGGDTKSGTVYAHIDGSVAPA